MGRPIKRGEAGGLRERGEVRVAEHFEVRAGKVPPQRRQRWQRENKITKRTAADDEDFALGGHVTEKRIR